LESERQREREREREEAETKAEAEDHPGDDSDDFEPERGHENVEIEVNPRYVVEEVEISTYDNGNQAPKRKVHEQV
jgi:hypothetical protein